MAFHTYMGYACAKEYREYRRDAAASVASLSKATSTTAIKVIGGGSGSSDSSVISSIDDVETVSSDEFGYPKAVRLNKIVNIVFIVSLVAFNVLYWSIATAVYFS